MKILFVSSELFNMTGGGANSRSYLEIVRSRFGSDNTFVFAFPKRGLAAELNFNGYITKYKYSIFQKIQNILFRGDPSIGEDVLTDLITYINTNNIDLVFLCRSTQGALLKKIKSIRPNVAVVVFYLDIYPSVFQMKKKNVKDFMVKGVLYHQYLRSDRYCSEEADACIVLNKRDNDEFFNYYHKFPDLISPIASQDGFDSSRICLKENEKLTLCFVGSYFGPNINGIRWFVKEVIPRVSGINLWIVGNKMERLLEELEFQNENITVYGTVDDLSKFYYEADLIIAPIFEGTGMKTKTAEALMYGKTMLATSEALEGYEIVLEFKCDTADEYIKRINEYKFDRPKKFDTRLREIYQQHYSVMAVGEKIEQLFLRVTNQYIE